MLYLCLFRRKIQTLVVSDVYIIDFRELQFIDFRL